MNPVTRQMTPHQRRKFFKTIFMDFGNQHGNTGKNPKIPLTHLAHGNGFPPGTYKGLITELKKDHHIMALPFRPLWPNAKPQNCPDWHTLSNDMIQGFDALEMKGVLGIGHSLGGVCSLFAAVKRPDLFRALVLIEPVILPPPYLWIWAVVRLLGQQRRFSLTQGALKRRRKWPSRQACFDYLRQKPLFSRCSNEALWHYVEAVTQKTAPQNPSVELAYPPEWEAHIFSTIAFDTWIQARKLRKLKTPVLFIRGEFSETFRPESQKLLQTLLPHAQFEVIPETGHLVPMEKPHAVAISIQRFFGQYTTYNSYQQTP